MRCFVGVDLSRYAHEFAEATARKGKYDRLRPTTYHHITLEFWPAMPDQEAERMVAAIDGFHYDSFTLTLDRLVAMPDAKEPQLIALAPGKPAPFRALHDAFQAHADEMMSDAQYYRTHTLFRTEVKPHVTLLRNPELEPWDSHKTLRKTKPLTVLVDNIGLYESLPAKGKEEYSLIAYKMLSA